MADRETIQRNIDRGRGKAADKLGAPFDVYRLSVTSGGNFLASGNKIKSGYPVLTRPASLGAHKEGVVSAGIIEYNLVGDFTDFLVGDIFVSVDTAYGAGKTVAPGAPAGSIQGFCLTQHASIRKAIGARINDTAQIYRLNKGVDPEGYWSSTLDNAAPLVLSAGSFAIASGTAAKIPIQLSPILRPYGERVIEKEPSNTRQAAYMAFVPPLPGFHFRSGDRLVARDGARYVVAVPGGQDVGAVGSTLFLQREVDQADGQ